MYQHDIRDFDNNFLVILNKNKNKNIYIYSNSFYFLANEKNSEENIFTRKGGIIVDFSFQYILNYLFSKNNLF